VKKFSEFFMESEILNERILEEFLPWMKVLEKN
jgi:hypothetical protein